MSSKRFKQAKIETRLIIFITLLYALWWYLFGLVINLSWLDFSPYVLWMPAWFFFSSVVGFVLFSLAIIIIVRRYFVNISLDAWLKNKK